MAHADSLPGDVLTSIANQLGDRMTTMSGPQFLSGSPVELTETFSVWALGADAVGEAAQSNADIQLFATPTGRWHHQVMFGSSAEAFARSTPLGIEPGSWSLREFFISPLADKIDKAVEWVDQNIVDDPLVRLLTVPAYQVLALWLTRDGIIGSQVLVVDAPIQYSTLQPCALLSSKEFIDRLLSEQHITGICF